MHRTPIVVIALLLFTSLTYSQTASEYVAQATEAFEKKDYARNVQLLEKAIAAGGDHPTILYFLARGHALSGDSAAAINTLNRLADLGVAYHPAKDQNFASIHNQPALKEVERKFQDNLNPTNNSSTAITIHDPKFVPEGIAYDPSDRCFYFGGVGSRSILAYNDGKFLPLSKPEDGLWSVLGMKIDPRTRTLWAASAALAGEDKGKSGIFQYDLKQRKFTGKFLLPEGNHVLGDVVVDSAGTAYTTDSNSPAIYVLRNGKLEEFIGAEPFRSPQGICLSADEKTLFVADYSRGIFAFDIATRKHRKVILSEGTTPVAGIDGLYCYKGSLIAIQNGVQPNRVLQIFLNPEATEIERVAVLESNHKLFPEPTLGTIVGDDFFYIGNSMIGQYLENPEAELQPAVILKLPLK